MPPTSRSLSRYHTEKSCTLNTLTTKKSLKRRHVPSKTANNFIEIRQYDVGISINTRRMYVSYIDFEPLAESKVEKFRF